MGLVPYTNIEDSNAAEANDINTRFGDVLAQVNGNLDASNIKNSSITRELLAGDALLANWPIGSVYISVTNTNPSTYFGGSWVAFATGRTIVGIDTAQTEFNAVEKTGGHKALQAHTHTGSTSSAGHHSHGLTADLVATSASGSARAGSAGGQQVRWSVPNLIAGAGDHTHSVTVNSSGAGDSGNLQPYITVYMFKRVS